MAGSPRGESVFFSQPTRPGVKSVFFFVGDVGQRSSQDFFSRIPYIPLNENHDLEPEESSQDFFRALGAEESSQNFFSRATRRRVEAGLFFGAE